MSDPAIAALIREVLAEELARIGANRPKEKAGAEDTASVEHVTVSTDGELASFVTKIMGFAADPKTRRRIEQGRLVFKLGNAPAPSPSASAPPPPQQSQTPPDVVTVASGFFSERQVDRLPKGTKSVRFGKAVRMTPLARDRLRHRGISIERTEQ